MNVLNYKEIVEIINQVSSKLPHRLSFEEGVHILISVQRDPVLAYLLSEYQPQGYRKAIDRFITELRKNTYQNKELLKVYSKSFEGPRKFVIDWLMKREELPNNEATSLDYSFYETQLIEMIDRHECPESLTNYIKFFMNQFRSCPTVEPMDNDHGKKPYLLVYAYQVCHEDSLSLQEIYQREKILILSLLDAMTAYEAGDPLNHWESFEQDLSSYTYSCMSGLVQRILDAMSPFARAQQIAPPTPTESYFYELFSPFVFATPEGRMPSDFLYELSLEACSKILEESIVPKYIDYVYDVSFDGARAALNKAASKKLQQVKQKFFELSQVVAEITSGNPDINPLKVSGVKKQIIPLFSYLVLDEKGEVTLPLTLKNDGLILNIARHKIIHQSKKFIGSDLLDLIEQELYVDFKDCFKTKKREKLDRIFQEAALEVLTSERNKELLETMKILSGLREEHFEVMAYVLNGASDGLMKGLAERVSAGHFVADSSLLPIASRFERYVTIMGERSEIIIQASSGQYFTHLILTESNRSALLKQLNLLSSPMIMGLGFVQNDEEISDYRVERIVASDFEDYNGIILPDFVMADLIDKTSYPCVDVSKELALLFCEHNYSKSLAALLSKHPFVLAGYGEETYSHKMYAHIAARAGHCAVIALLSERVDLRRVFDRSGSSLMHYAAQFDQPHVADLLLKQGHTINCEDIFGYSPFHYAAQSGSVNVMRLMLASYPKYNINRCIELNHPIHSEQSRPIHLASKNNHLDAVRWLLSKNARVNVFDKKEKTPLHYAAFHGNEQMAENLLQHGASINAVDKKGHSPLHLASRQGHAEMIEFLLARGGFLDIEDEKSASIPLHLAVEHNHLDAVKVLLDNKATRKLQISALQNNGKSALHIAAENGDLKIAKLLIKAGAFIDQGKKDTRNRSSNLSTPLHVASKNGHYLIVELLIEKGADVNVIMKNGATPLDLAIKHKHKKIARFLCQQPQLDLSLGLRRLKEDARQTLKYCRDRQEPRPSEAAPVLFTRIQESDSSLNETGFERSSLRASLAFSV